MNVPAWLLPLLACPRCRSALDGLPATARTVSDAPDAGRLSEQALCGRCGLRVEAGGVPDLCGVPHGMGETYDTLLDGFRWKVERDPARFEGIDAPLLAAAGRTTLEIGCGFGRLLDLLTGLSPRVERLVGVDLSPRSLEVAASRGHTVLRADALALPFRDGVFDAVVAGFGVLPHMPLGPALAEAARVTVPGGKVAFHTFGRRAQDLARVVGALVRLRVPPPRTAFHEHALSSFGPVRRALTAAGLRLTGVDCYLHVPGIKRVLGARPLVHVQALAPWSWDVVVVAERVAGEADGAREAGGGGPR